MTVIDETGVQSDVRNFHLTTCFFNWLIFIFLHTYCRLWTSLLRTEKEKQQWSSTMKQNWSNCFRRYNHKSLLRKWVWVSILTRTCRWT
jgi:hypothetical protein